MKTTLVIPIPKTGSHLDFKNISKFTENASEEQWKELWKEVANKLSEELEKTEIPKLNRIFFHFFSIKV